MKKNILFGFSVFSIAVVLIFNVAIATNGSNSALSSGLSLNFLGFCTQAQAENGTPTTVCNENNPLCVSANGVHYGKLTADNGNIWCCGVAAVTPGHIAS